MTRAEADEFLGPSIDPATAATLYDESGGNPFYLEQLARSLDRETTTPPATPRVIADLGVPAAGGLRAGRRAGCCSATAHISLLQGAAVVGDPFEPELAAAAAGVVESGRPHRGR